MTQAREYFTQGQAAYARGEYEEAARVWQLAYDISPAPALQYNLAQAYSRLGDAQRELDCLQRFVDGVPANDTNATTARLRIEAIQQRLARTGIHFADISAGADVTVDEATVTVPADSSLVVLAPGTHHIRIRQRGHRPIDAMVEVVAARTAEVPSNLQVLAPPHAPVAGYALLGGGAALLATGGTLGLVAYLRSPDAVAGAASGDSNHAMAVASDILVVAGAATAVTGLVLTLRRDRPESDGYDSARVGVVPYASRDGAGLNLAGRF